MRILMIIPVSEFKNDEPIYAVFIKREIETLESAGIEVIKLYLTSRYKITTIIKFINEVKEAIKRYSPQLIHIQTGTAGLFTIFSTIKLPLIVTIGGSEILGYSGTNFIWRLRGKIASFVSKLVCRKSSKIIVVSNNLIKNIPNKFLNKIVILPRAVNTSFFKPQDKLKTREKLNWEFDKLYIVFSDPRPHMRVKNIDLAKIVIEKTQKILNKPINLEVIFQKSPEEVNLMLNAADALIVTSFHEGSPNIIKEAMACNLPIISVPCGDVKERLQGVIDGEVISYDPDDLSINLARILKNPKRNNGREILEKQGLTQEAFILRIKDIYNSLI